MFPIRDARGRTIGFGGRVLDKGEPKYLNSPETELFHKGRELYGLYEARQASRTLTRLLVVEGYMDVVRLHQAGITYAVATLGTATTPEHLSRSVPHLQRADFLLRRRSGRSRGSVASAREFAESDSRRPTDPLSVPARRPRSRFAGRRRRSRSVRGAADRAPSAVRILPQPSELAQVDTRRSTAARSWPSWHARCSRRFRQVSTGSCWPRRSPTWSGSTLTRLAWRWLARDARGRIPACRTRPRLTSDGESGARLAAATWCGRRSGLLCIIRKLPTQVGRRLTLAASRQAGDSAAGRAAERPPGATRVPLRRRCLNVGEVDPISSLSPSLPPSNAISRMPPGRPGIWRRAEPAYP